MAKIFKVSAYVVDPVDEFDESSLEGCLVWCTQNDISLRCLKVDDADIDVGMIDDLHINRLDCGIEEFEKFFKGN